MLYFRCAAPSIAGFHYLFALRTLIHTVYTRVSSAMTILNYNHFCVSSALTLLQATVMMKKKSMGGISLVRVLYCCKKQTE